MNQQINQSTVQAAVRLPAEPPSPHILVPANDTGAELNARARAVAASLSRQPISSILVSGAARVAEFLITTLTGLAAYAVYVASTLGFDSAYAIPVVAAAAAIVIGAQFAGCYTIPALRSGIGGLGRVLMVWTAVFCLLAVAAFLLKVGHEYSRGWFIGWYLSGFVAIAAARLAYASAIRGWTKAGRLERRAVIVGGGAPADQLIRQIQSQPDNDIRICGIFDDRQDDRSPAMVAGYPKLGNVAELVAFGRLARIDLLLVSLPIRAEDRLLKMLKQLWVLPVDIRLSAHMNELRFRPRTYSYIGAVPLIDIFDKPIADWDYVAKWAFDRVVGTIALVALSPVMALTALAVRLDSRGPVLFKQKRYGFNNELIEVYKFRSMYVNQSDANAAKLVTKDDPRVTRVGRIIRKTSLDELPQLFNVVFKGNLSLIGPRPHAVQAKASDRLYDEVVDGYFARHRVKPGITGWAQINGWRGETDTEDKIQHRVEHDLHYIENWSVLFDLYILLMTPIRLLKTENAY